MGVRLAIGVGSVLYRGGSAPDCCPSSVPCLEAFLLLIPGNLEWLDKNKTSFLIMWRRPEEWGKLIYQWVRSWRLPQRAGGAFPVRRASCKRLLNILLVLSPYFCFHSAHCMELR